MQVPPTLNQDDEAEASLPTDHVRNGPNTNLNQYRTFTVRRKAAKRTFPWDLADDELQLAVPRPQDEDENIRETKRPRLEEPLITTETASQATTVALAPPDAAPAVDHADSDPVMDMHPTAGTTQALRCWTREEDAKLTSAVTKTPKKKRGNELRIYWKVIAVLVPGRTKELCRNRWRAVSDIDPTTALSGKWTADEDKKLKDSVREHGGKNWNAIAALVPGRTKNQISAATDGMRYPTST